MKSQLNIFLPLIIMALFISCNDMTNKVNDSLDKLNSKAQNLDSLLNKEVNKVMLLDSIIV